MSGHFVELVIESGELHRRFRCEEPEDADCRRRPPGDQYDAESWTREEATVPGYPCWAAEWVDAVGIEDAILAVCEDRALASVPVAISFEEGVGIEPRPLPDEAAALAALKLVWGTPGDIDMVNYGGGDAASSFRLTERGIAKIIEAVGRG